MVLAEPRVLGELGRGAGGGAVTPSRGGALPLTGQEITVLGVLGGAAAATGAALVVAGRRRRAPAEEG